MGKSDRQEVILAGEALRIIVNSYQSWSTHIAKIIKEKEFLLEESKKYLKKLEKIRKRLTHLNLEVKGETFFWDPEIERLWARHYYKQPRHPQRNLPKAQEHYQNAVNQGKRILKRLKDKNQKLSCWGVIGVAIGEVARVKEERLHKLRENFDEDDILENYFKSCDLVWKTRHLVNPEYDRIDAVFLRVFDYLGSHRIPTESKKFKKMISRYKILIKESELIRKRVKALVEKRKMPLGVASRLGFPLGI